MGPQVKGHTSTTIITYSIIAFAILVACYDGSDIHRYLTVNMAVGKSVNIRAILRYGEKIPM